MLLCHLQTQSWRYSCPIKHEEAGPHQRLIKGYFCNLAVDFCESLEIFQRQVCKRSRTFDILTVTLTFLRSQSISTGDSTIVFRPEGHVLVLLKLTLNQVNIFFSVNKLSISIRGYIIVSISKLHLFNVYDLEQKNKLVLHSAYVWLMSRLHCL